MYVGFYQANTHLHYFSGELLFLVYAGEFSVLCGPGGLNEGEGEHHQHRDGDVLACVFIVLVP
jgi:hypothetical protein